jgi:hypothetical protein
VCVYCAVRAECLNMIQVNFLLERVNDDIKPVTPALSIYTLTDCTVPDLCSAEDLSQGEASYHHKAYVRVSVRMNTDDSVK